MKDNLELKDRATRDYYNGKENLELAYKIYNSAVDFLKENNNTVVKKFMKNLKEELNDKLYAYYVSILMCKGMRKDPLSQMLYNEQINQINVNLLILLYLNGVHVYVKMPNNQKCELDADVTIDPEFYIDSVTIKLSK